jgi:hypothetical protein
MVHLITIYAFVYGKQIAKNYGWQNNQPQQSKWLNTKFTKTKSDGNLGLKKLNVLMLLGEGPW